MNEPVLPPLEGLDWKERYPWYLDLRTKQKQVKSER